METPTDKLFVYSQFRTPKRKPTSVQIDGLVNTPTRYELSSLESMPHIERLQTLECYVNTAGGSLIYTTKFQGVPLAALLHRAGVKPEAHAVRIETTDGHNPFRLPLSELQRPGTMLVSKLGAAAVQADHGSPYTRLFIPGAGGNHTPKWISRITLIEEAAPEHPAPPMAGFISPAPPETVGTLSGVALNGYAFAGPERIGRVELSTDGGATYQPMPLPRQPDPFIWMTWEVRWHPPRRGFYVLRVRATSVGGRRQDTPGVIAVDVR